MSLTYKTLPVSIDFNSSVLKNFQFKKKSSQYTLAELISLLKFNDLMKLAKNTDKFIAYNIYFENGKSIVRYINHKNTKTYFDLICWAWMIDRKIKNKNSISFNFDFENYNPGNVFDIDSFLNIENDLNKLIQDDLGIHFIEIKEEVANYLVNKIEQDWKENKIEYWSIESTYEEGKLIIKSKEKFSIDFTNKNQQKVYLFIILILSFITYLIIPSRIVEEKITVEEQKRQCSYATSEYDSASRSYDRQFKSSLNQFGSTATPGNISRIAREAQKLAPYSGEVSKALRSQNFWCKEVKPNSTLYKVNGSVYLDRESAEKSR